MYSIADDLPASVSIEPVTEADWDAWRNQTLNDFGRYVYGVTPEFDFQVHRELIEQQPAHGGTRSRYAVTITGPLGSHTVELLVILPDSVDRARVFLGLNFGGNAEAEEKWPISDILERGYGVATIAAADLEPDRLDGAPEGVRRVLGEIDRTWGTLGVWAWGLSVMRSQLAELDRVRSDQIVVIGHSRMGKAAIWAGAQDDQFAAVISNNAGCGGDSLLGHHAGEDIAAITKSMYFWFTPTYAEYAGRDHELPVDQHQLIACVSPRPAYVGSASNDDWADPVGQFLAVMAARQIQQDRSPIGFHLRPGKHDLVWEDWQHYNTFLDTHLPA